MLLLISCLPLFVFSIKTDNALVCNHYSDGDLHLSGIFPQSADAAVHQVAHALVVDAHDAADVLILAVLNIIEVDNLLLAGRQLDEELLDGVGQRLAVLHLLAVVFVVLGNRLHAGIGNLAVANLGVEAELVVDAITKGNIEVALYVTDGAEALLACVQLYEHVLDTIFQSLTVSHETRTESKESINMLIV